MKAGRLTSRDLVLQYLARIGTYEDARRVPDFNCAFNLVSLAYRSKFPAHRSLAQRLLGPPVGESNGAYDDFQPGTSTEHRVSAEDDVPVVDDMGMEELPLLDPIEVDSPHEITGVMEVVRVDRAAAGTIQFK